MNHTKASAAAMSAFSVSTAGLLMTDRVVLALRVLGIEVEST